MSTRKRTRASFNPNDDEDELSPSKPTAAPLSAAKKRKLNQYGKSKRTSIFGKLGGLLGLGQSGKENASEAEEKDELADDGDDSEADKEEGDIWEVPDEEEPGVRNRSARGTPASRAKATPVSQGKTGSAKSMKHNRSARMAKSNTYEVGDSEEDTSVTTSARAKRNVDHTSQIPKSTNMSKKDSADPIPKRGRPRKQIETEEPEPEPAATPKRGRPAKRTDDVIPSPKRSAGRPRKADILKKAKALSNKAIREEMKKAAAEAQEEAQISTRRCIRSKEAEVDDNESESAAEEPQTTASPLRRRGRPKHAAAESAKEPPKGILTPTKNRGLRSRKSVAFETQDDIDLGFKDLPDSKTTSKKGPHSKKVSQEHIQEPLTKASAKKLKATDLVETPHPEEEEEEFEDDDVACAVCKRLDSKRGNEIILCENCNFAVHLKCYDLPKIPKGDWFCRDCQPDEEDILDLEVDDDVAVGEVFKDLPDIEGFEGHLRHMQRLLLDRLTGQKRIKLRGHDEEIRKVYQVVEQTVLAGEGNSMLVIGARGCGKTTVSASIRYFD